MQIIMAKREGNKSEIREKLLNKYRNEITTDNIEQAAFLTANIIDRLLDAPLEKNPQWLADSNYLANIERAVMNYLCGQP